jgi:hypothetical protein
VPGELGNGGEALNAAAVGHPSIVECGATVRAGVGDDVCTFDGEP